HGFFIALACLVLVADILLNEYRREQRGGRILGITPKVLCGEVFTDRSKRNFPHSTSLTRKPEVEPQDNVGGASRGLVVQKGHTSTMNDSRLALLSRGPIAFTSLGTTRGKQVSTVVSTYPAQISGFGTPGAD